jgi:hypothetical protein
MIDPGAMGSLIIGLDDVRRREASTAHRTARPARRTRRLAEARRTFAAVLRRTATWIEPAPSPAA